MKSEKVALSELEAWFDQLIHDSAQEVSEDIERIQARIAEEKSKLRQNLHILASAEIRNPNIPERMRQVMGGNREIYLQRMNTLFEKMSLPSEVVSIHSFTTSYDQTMHEFSRSIAKSHHVMQEFLPKEAGAVTVTVTQIDKLIKEARALMEEKGFDKMEGIRNTIREILDKKKRKKIAEDEILDLEKESGEFERLIRGRKQKLEDIEEGEEYKAYRALEKEIDECEEEQRKLDATMKHSFSEIEAALKRYVNLNKSDGVAKDYLRNPIQALIQDHDLAIVDTLARVKEYIAQESITLKDKKKESVEKTMKEMKRSYFSEYLKTTHSLQKKIQKHKEKIVKAKVVANIHDTKKEIEKIERDFADARNRMSRSLQDVQLINIKEDVRVLEKEIAEKIKRNITITFS